MPCEIGQNVIVCRPPRGIHRRTIRHCPVCERRRRFVIIHMGIWYGSDLLCVACGDRWGDGEMYPRPFARGWRDKAKEKGRALWASAMTRADYDAAVGAELDAYLTDEVTA